MRHQVYQLKLNKMSVIDTTDKWFCEVCKEHIFNVVKKEMHEKTEKHIQLLAGNKKVEEMAKGEDGTIRVRNTPEFKLKDKPKRRYTVINMKKMFGFIPEVIIVEKVFGHSNTMVVRAILTKEEAAREDKEIAAYKAKQKLLDKKLKVENKENGISTPKTK